MFYIQILHHSHTQKKCAHPWLYTQSELAVINELLLDVSQLVNILTEAACYTQTVSLLETTRLKPTPLLMLFHSCFSPFRQ